MTGGHHALPEPVHRPAGARPSGEPIGNIADLIVAIGDRYPPVTGLVVRTDQRRIFLPWRNVEQLDEAGARLRVPTIDIGKFRQRPDEILLKQDLLDKQIVDIEGRKVVRVNDLGLDEIEGTLRVVAVDVGAAGPASPAGRRAPVRGRRAEPAAALSRALHRLGGRRSASRARSPRQAARPPRRPGRAPPGRPRLDHRPAAAKDRPGVLASLDDEAAADAIEEMEPDTQVEVLEDLEPARAADILEEMSPDDAADLVADLSDDSREEILALMERDEAAEVTGPARLSRRTRPAA